MYMFGQIIRVVVSGDSATGKHLAQYSQYTKNKKGKKITTQGYRRIYLLRDLKTNGLIFNTIEDRAQKKSSWKKDTTLRNNGVVTIGTCITIPNTKSIKSYMVDDIPLFVTMNYAIVLKSFNLYPTANVQSSIVKI